MVAVCGVQVNVVLRQWLAGSGANYVYVGYNDVFESLNSKRGVHLHSLKPDSSSVGQPAVQYARHIV
jgi:hypothetical protein